VGRVEEVLGVMAVVMEVGLYGDVTRAGVVEMTLILDDRSVSAQHWAESGQERLAVSIEDPDHLGVVRLSGQQDGVVGLLRRMLEAAESAVARRRD
jgi:hypothetical protein